VGIARIDNNNNTDNTTPMTTYLTDQEKQAIKVLNFIAEHDGIIQSEDEIRFILNRGIEKFIPKSRRHLVSITKTAYPIRIKYYS
jgi:hypothetical protein